MTTEPAAPLSEDPAQLPAGERSPAPDALEGTLRRALRTVLIFLAVLAVVGVAVGIVVSGVAGLWGALMGAGVAVFFSGATIVAVLRTAHSTPTTTVAVIMGSWLVKMVVLIAVLAVLRGMDFYDRWIFGAVLLVGVIGSATLDYRAVSTGRVPYVDPSA